LNNKNQSFNKINIKKMDLIKKGQKLFAKTLNEPRKVLNSLGGAAPPSQVLPGPSKAFQMKMFKVIELDTDIIKCFTWNGIEKGEDEIKVALPFLLRKTPFDDATRTDPPRADISYVYSDFHIRIATNADGDDEDQILVASYETDDIIYAIKGIFGNTSVYHDDPSNETPVIWLDANIDGRFWALDDDPPEES